LTRLLRLSNWIRRFFYSKFIVVLQLATMGDHNEKILAVLTKDGAGVMPTDTTYGLVGSAFSEMTVEKIYELKSRDTQKPHIILISGVEDLAKFDIFPDQVAKKVLEKVWPGQVTVILPCKNAKFAYLHRGGNSLAFRVPDKADLREMLRESGPLVAPSANPEGKLPAKSIEEARKYFGDTVDFYQDGGVIESLPSTIMSLLNDVPTTVRSGAGDDLIKRLGYN
jgi:L-threonylcarbamoyladenylate synthase